MNFTTKQKNLGKCRCGRNKLTGNLRTYNGYDKNLCPQCNAERIIYEITGRTAADHLDSNRSAGESGVDDGAE